jgi:hypothetical protein
VGKLNTEKNVLTCWTFPESLALSVIEHISVLFDFVCEVYKINSYISNKCHKRITKIAYRYINNTFFPISKLCPLSPDVSHASKNLMFPKWADRHPIAITMYQWDSKSMQCVT